MDSTELAILYEDDIIYLRNLVSKLRAGLQEIYAIRGEDEVIANICNPLIETSRDF